MNEHTMDALLRRELVRLLKQIGAQTAGIEARDDAVLVRVGSGEARRYPPPVVAKAVSLGLLKADGATLCARPEARSYLRRALAGIEEESFVRQHGERVDAPVADRPGESAVERPRLNLDESPLAHLKRLKDKAGAAFLPQAAVDAGERLCADFTRAGWQPRITASWEPRLSSRGKGHRGGAAEMTDGTVAAGLRLRRAIEAMGPELSGVALDVCCFMKGLEMVERERQWPVRSGKLMLRTALLALARHYAPPPSGGRTIGHWGTEDFRPEL